MIELRNMQVRKNGTTICHVPELSIETGARVGILGSNGSGKTTLLRVLAGLEPKFQGECVVRVPRKDRLYVHQNPYLFRGTVLYNVMYGLRAHGLNGSAREKLALCWMEMLGIRKLADRRANHLSGGEKRRTALVRALVLKPRLLLLDEPMAELDHEGIVSFCAALRELTGTTILFASPAELPQGVTTKDYWLKPLGDRSHVGFRSG